MILRDEQWEKLEPLLLGREGDPGMQARDNRLFIEAVFWYVGVRRWRNLPPEFGKWNTAYMRFRRWNLCGIWHRLKAEVKDDPELLAHFEKIVAHADHVRLRAAQKANRRSARQAYSWPALKSGSEIEAASDWLRLVMGPTRQRTISK
ncbi:transposase [Collimonas sp.]|jgi:transposase|uniref:transposase n=1 Tax=Collimonas sp. TaxID=1963772 RepID=UPI002CCD21FE|nr:transposase [Collimonas sp.]HWX01578.1 transposase [Collimonas sp.]